MGMEAEGVQQVSSMVTGGIKVATEGVNLAKEVGEPTAKAAGKIIKALWNFTQNHLHRYKHLVREGPVLFLSVKDGLTKEETQDLLKNFEKDMDKMGVHWSYTKIDTEVNGIPTTLAFRASDLSKIETLMTGQAYKNHIALNMHPTEQDFDPSIPAEDVKAGIDSSANFQKEMQEKADQGKYLKGGTKEKKVHLKAKQQSEKIMSEIKNWGKEKIAEIKKDTKSR